MNMKRIQLLTILMLLPLQLLALDVPQLGGRVNDLARMLSPDAASRLEQKLAAFERDQSTQIVVLTIPSLQGDDIDQFTIRVADQWKIGQKVKDNGVLLVLAQAERKVRIEVGMGLQGVLTDLTAGRIIREVMRPHLKAGNFEQGIAAGVDGIIAATQGEFKADPQDQPRKMQQRKSSPALTFFLLAAVAAAILGTFSRYLGGAAGAAGLPLASIFAFPALSLVTLAILAAVGFGAGLLLSTLLSGMVGGGRGGGGGGFYWGGGGGGFGGGGFGGGDGGFSGGGGGFDGGGASGDW